jgi:heme oxygenase
LRDDIRALTGTPESEIEKQLDTLSRNGRLAAVITHTRRSVDSNPHVLLAYTWVLYLALFSGGRYLRAALAEAGGARAEFWERDPSPVRPYSVTKDTPYRRRCIKSDCNSHNTTQSSGRSKSRSESGALKMSTPGLQFFNFAGDEDGENIKLEFKKRFKEVEALLTSGEKEDIITEAEYIFKFMVEIVNELDVITVA